MAQAAQTGGAWLTRFQVTHGECRQKDSLSLLLPSPCSALLLPAGTPCRHWGPRSPASDTSPCLPWVHAGLLPASLEPFPGRPRGLACGLPGAQGTLTAAWKSEGGEATSRWGISAAQEGLWLDGARRPRGAADPPRPSASGFALGPSSASCHRLFPDFS